MASDAKLQAWFTFLQAHDAATGSLDAELRERAGLTLSDYEVLLHLDRAAARDCTWPISLRACC